MVRKSSNVRDVVCTKAQNQKCVETLRHQEGDSTFLGTLDEQGIWIVPGAVARVTTKMVGSKVDQGLGGLQKQDNHPGQSLTTDWGLGVQCMYIKVAN